VLPPGLEDYEFVRDTGLLKELQDRGDLIGADAIDRGILAEEAPDACYVLAHPRLTVVSFPYEWSFPALRDAAVLQLNVHLAALERGVTLSDASAYNIQFEGPRPVFIDYLSFGRYREGEFWNGHRQFCEQFLNPLLLTSLTGVPFQAWYRGNLNGISPVDLARLLPMSRRVSWRVFMHVTMQGRLQTPKVADEAARVSRMKLPLDGYKRMLTSLRDWISGLTPSKHRTTQWQGYATDNSYSEGDAQRKKAFVAEFVTAVQPQLLLDIGCNTGEYSEVAVRAGARSVVGLEADHGALDAAYERARARNLPVLPLFSDALNPTPAQGWAGRERPGLMERLHADAVMALAFIHHIAIANNVPLREVVDWIMDFGQAGVIEFVPKSDPMVKRLLQLRRDIFEDYTEDAFLAHVKRRAEVVATLRLEQSDRLLVWYRR
jgi:ribosomal protein L11 methylase PrmA